MISEKGGEKGITFCEKYIPTMLYVVCYNFLELSLKLRSSQETESA